MAGAAVVPSDLVTVSWNPSTDPSVDGYCVYYGTASGNYTTRIDAGTNTHTVITNLSIGTTYYFVATAYNSALVESSPSPEAVFTVSTNPAPVLLSIPTQIANVLEPFTVTNSVTEPGAGKRFTYSLAPGAPASMSVNSTNGVVSWMPLFKDAGITYPVTVQVTDNQTPPSTATTSFNVAVSHAAQLGLSEAVTAAGKTNSSTLSLNSSTALTNLTFTLELPAGRISSFSAQSLQPQIAAVTQQSAGANAYLINVSALGGQTLPTSGSLLEFNFTATAGQHSTFSALSTTNESAFEATGDSLPKTIGSAGRLVLIGPETLVDARQTNGARALVLYGNVGTAYTVQSTSNPKAHSTWSTAYTGTFTNQTVLFSSVPTNVPAIFYRAYTAN